MIDTTKMNDKEILLWIESIKKELKTRKEYKKATDTELNNIVMDGMFQGFANGELRRIDLAAIARVLGFRLSDDFLNDPNPDPYELKHRK